MNRFMTLMVCGCFAASADASLTHDILVEIHGDVFQNQIGTSDLAGVMPGETVTYSFMLDSGSFVDGAMFPTRGYDIDLATFSLSFSGGVTVGAADPYPAGQTPQFVLRDNDPAVDGFHIGSGNPDAFPSPILTDQAGVFDNFAARFSVSYVGDTLDSLDILDAVGSYDFTGLTVFGTGIGDGPFDDVLGIDFSGLTISEVPAPPAAAGLISLGLFAVRRRR